MEPGGLKSNSHELISWLKTWLAGCPYPGTKWKVLDPAGAVLKTITGLRTAQQWWCRCPSAYHPS